MPTILENVPLIEKAPGVDSDLDYKFDFAPATNNPNKSGLTDWLEVGETIVSFTVVAFPNGITEGTSSITDSGTSVTLWVSDGTSLETYRVGVNIVTSSGRKDTRLLDLYILPR